MSYSLKKLPVVAPGCVSLSDEDPNALVKRLEHEGLKHLYIDGGYTIQSFLTAELIDELIITTIPILLGTGKSLFGPLPNDLHL